MMLVQETTTDLVKSASSHIEKKGGGEQRVPMPTGTEINE